MEIIAMIGEQIIAMQQNVYIHLVGVLKNANIN